MGSGENRSEMPSHIDDAEKWYAFCGFNASGSTFARRYIYSEQEKLVTPCAELLLILFDHFLFLFFIVLGFFHVKNSARIPSARVRFILTFKLFVTLSTCVILTVSLFSGIFSNYILPSVLLIEYGVVVIVWLIFAVVWFSTIHYNAWTRPLGMSITYGFASKAFIIIFVHRCIKYGLRDFRTYPILAILCLHALNYILCAVEFFLTKRYQNLGRLFDNSSVDELNDVNGADEGANIFSKLFFCWTNALLRRGYRGEIKQVEDLFKLPPSLRILRVEREFLEAAPTEFTDARPFSFAHALFRAFGCGYLLLGVQCFFGDCLKFAGPILLHLLITSFEKGGKDENGYFYATFMLIASFVSSVSACSFNFYVNKVSLKIRCALLTAVYDKLLQIPSCRLSAFSTGQLINFMSTDVDRIVGFCTSFHAVWSMPLNLAITLYLLYREVGMAFLAGLAMAVITVPVNKFIASKIGYMSTKMMSYKDQRMRIVSETMRAIRVVKLNNWEPYFEEKINEIRAKELRYLKARKYLDAVCVYLWASAPILITIAILVTYTVILKEQLTAAKVFTSLALVNILILPLNAFPWVLNSLVEAFVSKKRFDKFFAIENMDLFSLYGLTDAPQCQLQVENAKFSWSEGKFSVGNVAVRGEKGHMIGVVGPVGCGKSTILMGILGETDGCETKAIRIRQSAISDGFAYVGQDCWLRRGSIRDNILCDSPMNSEFYREVLHATALQYDVDSMPGQDGYLIGDEGTTLSGGQRARLALARAVYQNNDVVLLDDPFASLDAKVAEFIYENCIQKILRDRGKTVILCTHHVKYLRHADHVICLNGDGSVRSEGLPSEVLPLLTTDFSEISISADSERRRAGTSSTDSGNVEFSEIPFDNVERVDAEAPAEVDESKEHGTVKIGVYWSYLSATGYGLAVLIIAALFAMQISKNGSDVWLSKWTLNSSSSESQSDFVGQRQDYEKADWSYLFGAREVQKLKKDDYSRTTFFLTVYVCVALFNTVFTLIRAFLFAYGGVVAAQRLHHRLLNRVLNSTVAWWDETPWGRVVNRLCADVYTVDDSLPFQLNICLASLFNLFGTLLITLLALPFLTPIVIILLILYYLIQRYYRFANCEVKRISSLTLSPLYSHITDTVTGLVTIRAHRFAERFTQILRERLDRNLRAQFSALAASQWLSVRLQLLGVVMVSAVSYTGVTESRYLSMETGLIALAITYALSITNTLSSLLTSFIDTEKELVSVERIADFVENVPLEETSTEVENLDKFLFCRAIKGQIDFTCVSLRYGPGLPLALKNVTFRVEAGQRVAIIGRTGAGKSSIFQALLRAHPIETGKIFIDGGALDIMKMDPRAVRSMFGFVSQSPFIFSGTIRENLTMNNSVLISDDAILEVISKAGLDDWLTRCGGLGAKVTEGGRNFSFGEKQIICLCRLILAKPKIVLIDEATAHMNEAKHLEMTDLIRSQLSDATLLSIVHRTTGLERFDWIIELSNGAIHRQGRPAAFQNVAGIS